MASPIVQEIDDKQTRWDYASATVRYQGHAAPSALTVDKRWRIKKFTFDSSGRHVRTEFAGFNAEFVNAWDDRTTFSYDPNDPSATG